MQPTDAGSATSGTSEIEWQFDVADLDVIERWLATDVPHGGLVPQQQARRQILDSYIDSDGLQLRAADLVGRLRTDEGRAEVTLKSLTSEGDPATGLRRRLELNQPLSYALLYRLIESRGPVIDRIRQHVSPRDLRVLFTARTDRRTWSLADSGQHVGEISLDDATIEVGSHTATIRRIEVEAATPEDERRLAPFVEVLRIAHRLAPGSSSKFDTGLELARLAGVIESASAAS